MKYLVSEHKDHKEHNDREADADEKDTVSGVVEISKHISLHEAIQSLKNVIQYFEEKEPVLLYAYSKKQRKKYKQANAKEYHRFF